MNINEGVIVFGGSGFIGSHLISYLIQSGCKNIVSLDIKEPVVKEPGVVYLLKDVRDLGDLEIYPSITQIYNFAAIHTTPGHEHHEYYDTNISGALEVCKYAEKANIKEIVFTSSISVYGPGEEQKKEESALKPISSYGYSKMLAENIHKDWMKRVSDSNLVIVRPAVVFGAREGGNFTRLATLLNKGFFIYPGRKDTIKACIYVEDLLDAIEFAKQQKEKLIIFNGAYHHGYTLENIISIFKENHFKNVKTFLVPRVIVTGIAKFLRMFNAFNIGIHPDRVMKLVQSTDVYPGWLVSKGKIFDQGLKSALQRWSNNTSGTFK
ncbi:SDR family oxidoreductase [Psychromonas sp. RZ22]|uniref:NAD-dependent epimerase/dehydratase family protein n=1 Tax=Psychromonas algarum TaxID=2555643 RepID=UPI001067532E|nr:SDR family oxidoreductase [Psychromonas sp. RZ22]TEW56163.1 SDR family oxidoreductase [Psychromonas sp. RZ22]